MKKMLLLCGTLMLLTASVASAGLNLAFDACRGDGGADYTGACASNLNTPAKATHFYGSFVLAAPLAKFQAADGFVSVTTPGALPAWWGSACAGRPTPFFAASPANVGCSFSSYGTAVGTAGGLTGVNYSTNSVAFEVIFAVPAGQEQALIAGREYFAFDVQLDNIGSTGACAGCATAAGLNFGRCDISYLGGVDGLTPLVLADTQAATAGSNCAQMLTNTPAPCTGGTPTRNATWGSVKALYR